GALYQRIVYHRFQRDDLAAPESAVTGNHIFCFPVLYTIGNRLRREAAENYRMNRADARAGQYGYSQFRHHSHVNTYPVSFLHAIVLKHIGKIAYLLMQLLVSEYPKMLFGIIGFPNNSRLIA